MATTRNTKEQTSKSVASTAAKLMHHPSPAVRKVAGSALTQAANHGAKGKKPG